jgi:hypothetical protein
MIPYTDIALPARAKLLTEIVDPMCKKSNTLQEDPIFTTPYTECELPHLAKFLSDRLDPICRKSRTDMELPSLTVS